MPIKIKSSGGGSITLDVPSTAVDTTLFLPTSNGAAIYSNTSTAFSGNVSVSGANSYININGSNVTPFAMKNRLINGAMVIDQRYAGASANNQVAAVYSVDRWVTFGSQATKFSFQRNAGSVTPPPGFTNYVGITSLSSYSLTSTDYNYFGQWIEGYNIAGLDLGKSTSKSLTLSFWVRSSLTGAFGGSFYQSGTNNFPFSYTINSANTWEFKTVVISPDISGTTYNTTNGNSVILIFGLGTGATYSSGAAGSWSTSNNIQASGTISLIGTAGATLYITGVQLEAGPVASPFEYRPYSMELELCQRYYEKTYDIETAVGTATTTGQQIGIGNDINDIAIPGDFKVTKRATPTMTIYNPNSGALGTIYDFTNGVTYTPSTLSGSQKGLTTLTLSGSTGTAHGFVFHWTANAEL